MLDTASLQPLMVLGLPRSCFAQAFFQPLADGRTARINY